MEHLGHIGEGKRFHHSASPSLFTFNASLFSFYYFTVERGFPPKIKTTIFGVVLVLTCTKALGGITVVMHPISTDRILVDHICMKLSLMGSTGTPLEVNSIP